MKNLFLFYKSVVLGIWLLMSIYGRLQAQEITIKDFKILKTELEERLKANSSDKGKIYRNLDSINSKFIKEIYKDTSEINEMIKILTKALGRITTDGKDREIVVKINDVFTTNLKSPTSKADSIPQNKTESDSIKMLKEKISKLKEDIDGKYSIIWWIVPSCLALMFLGLSIIFIIKNNEKSKTVKELEGQIEELKYENRTLQNTINEIKRTDNSNQQQLSNNTTLISQLETKISNLEKKLALKESEKSTGNNSLQSTPPAKVYYFSTPQPDGTFNDNNKSDLFIATASMYKFTLLSNNKAHFEFINDDSTLRDALNYPDSYLLPVCRAENTRNIKATKITTIGKGGIAELSDGRWTVTEKAVIRYD